MSVRQQAWGTTEDSRESYLFTIKNDLLQIGLTDLGASIVSIRAPDRNGTVENIVVGGERFSTYQANSSYLGATVGRYANRIGRGRFQLGGHEYVLAVNNGPNHLHGGSRGLTHRQWEATTGNDSVTFTTVSPHGEDGYPGTLQVELTYRLSGRVLSIEYRARTDAPTVLSMTNHTYWNLSGHGSVLQQQLKINADRFLEIDKDVLPTGRILDVDQTPFDFRRRHAIGELIDQTNGGYDNCLVITGWNRSLKQAAIAMDPVTGRTMEVWTTEPGIQLYTANHFDGSPGTGGAKRFEAFCLECQHFPDSPNQSAFPSTVLKPGEEYHQKTEHHFGVDAG